MDMVRLWLQLKATGLGIQIAIVVALFVVIGFANLFGGNK